MADTLAEVEARVSLLEDAVELIQTQITNLTPKTMTNALNLAVESDVSTLRLEVSNLKTEVAALRAIVHAMV